MGTKGLKFIKLAPDDAQFVDPWYKARGEEGAPMPELAPYDRFFGVLHEGQLVACAFLIETNTRAAMVEYVMTDDRAPVLVQSRALMFIIDEMMLLAKYLGYSYVLGLVGEDHESLAKYYIRNQAVQGSKKMKVFYKHT